MKLKSNLNTFGDVFKESLHENNANYGSIGGQIASGPGKRDKYSPPTVEQVPSIRFTNNAIKMGQTDTETDAPENFIYPFQSVFTDLIGTYVKLNELRDMIKSSRDLPTISSEKKKLIDLSIKQLTFSINELKLSIENIEKLTL